MFSEKCGAGSDGPFGFLWRDWSQEGLSQGSSEIIAGDLTSLKGLTHAPLTGTAPCAVRQLGAIRLGCTFIIFITTYHGAHKYLARETAPKLQ